MTKLLDEFASGLFTGVKYARRRRLRSQEYFSELDASVRDVNLDDGEIQKLN